MLLAVVGLLILAAGLPGMRFQPGQPIPGAETVPLPAQPGGDAPPAAAGIASPVPWLLHAVLALGFLLLLGVFVVILLKKASKKRVGLVALGLLAVFVLLSWLPWEAPARQVTAPAEAIQAAPTSLYTVAPIGDPPAGLLWAVTAALLLAAASAAGWLLFRAFRRPKKEDALAREADAALRAIQDGENLRSVILRSYVQMTRAVQQAQGIEREETVTAREFEQYLASRGIAREPVRQLTRLFEKARYDCQPPDRQDEQAAVDCLSAIRAAVRGAPERGAR